MTRLNAFPLIFSAVFCIFTLGCGIPSHSAKKDFQKTITVNSTVEVSAETFNGYIDVTPSDSDEINLVAHIKCYGNSEEEATKRLDLLEPEIEKTKSSLRIRCRKPSGQMMTMDSVSLELKVPRTWPLQLITSNGTIKTSELHSAVTAETSNGQIEIKNGEGQMTLSTSNGNIVLKASHGNVQASTSNGRISTSDTMFEGKCSLTTSNGSIETSLSQESIVEFNATTSNGSIQCDETNLRITNRTKKEVHGTWLGSNGASDLKNDTSIEMVTSNGSIRIKSTIPSNTKTENPSTLESNSQ